MSQFKALKQRVYECNIDLPRKGIVIYTFGNVSGIDRDAGVVAIKPSGVSYDEMTPDDMVIVDLDGNLVEGKLRPSSDTATHLVLYKHFPRIGGVAHTHSKFAVVWAQATKPIPILGTTHADHLPVDIPVTDVMSDEAIARDYEVETGRQIIERFKDLNPDEVMMVLVAGHGPFTWGESPEKAVYHSVVLEEMAQMALYTLMVNPNTPPLKPALIRKHYERKHGKNAYYGQS